MDAIRLYINGVKNVVALIGTALTKEQIELIKRLRCEVILGLDGDEAGKNATLKNGEILVQNNIKVQVVRISLKKDPDEYVFTYGIDGYIKMLDNPIDYLDFKLETLKSNINAENTLELTNYVNKVLDDLKTIKDPIYLDLSLTKLSKTSNSGIGNGYSGFSHTSCLYFIVDSIDGFYMYSLLHYRLILLSICRISIDCHLLYNCFLF